MTPRQAALVIGCTAQHVRLLIRFGRLRARRVPSNTNQYGYHYSVSAKEAKRYRDTPQSRGWPRGKLRGPRDLYFAPVSIRTEAGNG